MLKSLRSACLALLLFTLVTGLAYPLIVTGIAQATMSEKANGSLLHRDGKLVGSALIGQNFAEPKYLWGRLSATGPFPYNAANSGGSNLGPLNPALADAAKARIDALDKANLAVGIAPQRPVPADLITASGSGLDPEISADAAAYQVSRIARSRGMSAAAIDAIIAAHTEGRWLGLFGSPRVNVLQVNLALDQIKP